MIIVQGIFRLEPAERDAFLAQNVEGMRISRSDPGCLEYVIAPDPVESDRVILSERWASRDDLDQHFSGVTRRREEAAARGDLPEISVLSREVSVFEATPTTFPS